MGYGRDSIKNRDVFAASKNKSPTASTYHPDCNPTTRAYSMGKKL